MSLQSSPDTSAQVFPKALAERWRLACERLEQAGYGKPVVNSYKRNSRLLANQIDPLDAVQLADFVSLVAIKSGKTAAQQVSLTTLNTAIRLQGNNDLFRSWIALMERFLKLAPESMLMTLQQMDQLLNRLSIPQLESWLLAGVRGAAGDAEQRKAFFSFSTPDANRWLERESGSIIFTDIQRELQVYLGALWGLHMPLREIPMKAVGHEWRRSTYGGGIIHMPPSFSGFRGDEASDLFRASVAHMGAHLRYSATPFPVKQLKPMQVALISLIEDARIESLAIEEFPGLKHLWQSFHVATPSGVKTAPSLFARLSRALIDPDYQDEESWVIRGREMVEANKHRWDQDVSREIGGLLGNNLGQMRVQFNAKDYVVQPAYRDDNRGLWDFGGQQSDVELESDMVLDSAQIEENVDEDPEQKPEDERVEQELLDDSPASPISVQTTEEDGISVARYPEFDYITGSERQDWTTIVEYTPESGRLDAVQDTLDEYAHVVKRIKNLISNARVSQPQRLNKQYEGDYLDIDACIDSAISKRLGVQPDPRVYCRTERRGRDLSVMVILDASESTNDKILGHESKLIDIEVQATALLANAMDELNDPFAISAFCSNKREEVHYYRIKDFDEPYDALAQSYLSGLSGKYSTRLGAAIRHAAEDLKKQLTHRRLILVLSDGEPSDIDVTDEKYLVEDARHAVHKLAQDGIDVFCVGLDSGGANYLSKIFGRKNFVLIKNLDTLPEQLPLLYLRLT